MTKPDPGKPDAAAAAAAAGRGDGRSEDGVPEAMDVGPAVAAQAEDLPPPEAGDALRAERDALQDQLLRLAAEFDNYRKRNAREWQEQRRRAAADVLRELLEIADNLERALGTAGDDTAGLRRGVELIHQQLLGLFKRAGIEPVLPVGKPFDPTEHEAVLVVDSDVVGSQHVVDVVQPGYKLHGQVLRPARVTVSR